MPDRTPRDSDRLALTFEDDVWALLRARRKPSRGSTSPMTRAQFIERLIEEARRRKQTTYQPPNDERRGPAASAAGDDRDV